MKDDMEQMLLVIAMQAMNGMLSHQKRYHNRPEDSDVNWHRALSREAFDIAQEMLDEYKKRIATQPTL